MSTLNDINEISIRTTNTRRAEDLEILTRLAGGVFHDLNNKLMVINANIDMAVKQVKKDPSVTRKLLAAAIASEQAGKILSELMFVLNPKKNGPQNVRISDSLTSLTELLNRSLVSRNVQVVQKTDDPTLAVRVENDEMQAALANLIVRLCDQMISGGRIDIATQLVNLNDSEHDEGDFVKITIEGTTLSEFPEYRNISLNQWSAVDMGQMNNFLDASFGVLQFEPTASNNYVAAIYLPAAESIKHSTEEFDPGLIGINNQSTRGFEILIVDDEVEVARSLQAMVEKIGYKGRIAIGAREAVKAITSKRPSLVLSDVAMRGPNGITLAREMRDLYPNLPFVLITGDQRFAQEDTEFVLLQKPISSDRLAYMLHRILSEKYEKKD